ncbi:hypothetical protein [Methylobacterium isbiliense]|jgi:hypothetical protein|uniref:Uncharacterized protein n=1 Tax=Methylobacterium isbiliense TaxID=315478 RepID=A0ABQ4SDR9_9HYPH|nr:hypothetical protein [Methylobacterium isbiliense]MDN3622598.1 hypothetical protein [Methylobacterium isbiliense]GJE00553.1 hypothetical protein GMJLKIPL_2476 [Methylobacterium isbiliense]
MRISVDERDSGYRTLVEWGGPTAGILVTLNGEEVFGCITADEELGEVLVQVFDENDCPVVNGDEFRREWRRGVVEVSMPAMMFG